VLTGLVPTLGEFGLWLVRSRARRAVSGLEPKQAEKG